MITLISWCPNCSWWLLPLLIGAWILGWLLWGAFKGGQFKNIIKGLQGDLTDLRTQKTEVETDLAKANYEFERVNSEKLGLFNDNKAWEEKYNQLSESVSSTTTTTVDTSEYQAKIAEQAAKLENFRKTNLQLESDFAGLKERYASLETQMDAPGDSSGDTDTSNYNAQIDDLKRQLDAAHAANTQLKSEYSAFQAQMESTSTNVADIESDNNKLADIALQLSIAKNANAELEANYANLKSEFGEMELSLQAANKGSSDDTAYTLRIEELKKQLEESEHKSMKLEKEYKKLKKKHDEAATIVPLVSSKPKKKVKKPTKPKVFKEDDLTKIEGIGPKIQGLLKEASIRTWKQLSKTPTPKLRKILNDAGSRYKMHNPSTWAEQALLAADGKWDELKKWQDELDGGR